MYPPAQTNLLRSLCVAQEEFTSPLPLRLCIGTYNVNGGRHFRSVAYKNQNLADWLLDAPRIARGQGRSPGVSASLVASCCRGRRHWRVCAFGWDWGRWSSDSNC